LLHFGIKIATLKFRETDLHKFDNLFLNPIEHCLSIYIGIIVC
jgi:hypothetical protein